MCVCPCFAPASIATATESYGFCFPTIGIQTDLINLLDLRRLHADASPEKSDCSDEEDENVKVDGNVEDTEKDDDKPFISNIIFLLSHNSSFLYIMQDDEKLFVNFH